MVLVVQFPSDMILITLRPVLKY